MSAQFSGHSYDRPEKPAIKEPTEVIFAGYTYEDYSGDAFVVYRDGRKFYTVEGGHCSCYGLEGQWDPIPYTLKQLIASFEKRDQSWGLFGAVSKELIKTLKERKEVQ